MSTPLEVTTHAGEHHFLDAQGRLYLVISPALPGGRPGLQLHDPNTGKAAAQWSLGREGGTWLTILNEDGSDALLISGGGKVDSQLSGGGIILCDGIGRSRAGLGSEGDGAWLSLIRDHENTIVDLNSYRHGWVFTFLYIYHRWMGRVRRWIRRLPKD